MSDIVSHEDKQMIGHLQDNSPVVRYLRSKDNLQFAVGDYLIRQHKQNDQWKNETVSHITEIPKRFKCIFIDEYGICYLKPMTSLGTELPTIIQLAETNDWTRYTLDPQYADHMILSDNEKFDFTEQRKKEKAHRDHITRKNKKIVVRRKTKEELDKILEGLKPGDKFWFGSSVPEAAISDPYIITKIEWAKNSGWSSTPEWQIECSSVRSTYVSKFSTTYLLHQCLFLQEPFSYETI